MKIGLNYHLRAIAWITPPPPSLPRLALHLSAGLINKKYSYVDILIFEQLTITADGGHCFLIYILPLMLEILSFIFQETEYLPLFHKMMNYATYIHASKFSQCHNIYICDVSM